VDSPPFLASDEAFAAFVTAWEQGTLPPAQWSHAAHVSIGACYAVRHGDGAIAKLRAGIRRYNEAVGTANTATSGYHETLTRFWAGVIAEAVAGYVDERQAACHAVARFGHDRDRPRRAYSFDVVSSLEARRTWIAPDLAG
jgi:hypothetical protein